MVHSRTHTIFIVDLLIVDLRIVDLRVVDLLPLPLAEFVTGRPYAVPAVDLIPCGAQVPRTKHP